LNFKQDHESLRCESERRKYALRDRKYKFKIRKCYSSYTQVAKMKFNAVNARRKWTDPTGYRTRLYTSRMPATRRKKTKRVYVRAGCKKEFPLSAIRYTDCAARGGAAQWPVAVLHTRLWRGIRRRPPYS